MQHDSTLQHKVLQLLLTETGLHLTADQLASLSSNLEIGEQLASIRQRLSDAAQAIPCEPDASPAVADVELRASAIQEIAQPPVETENSDTSAFQAEPTATSADTFAATHDELSVPVANGAPLHVSDETREPASDESPALAASEVPSHEADETPALASDESTVQAMPSHEADQTPASASVESHASTSPAVASHTVQQAPSPDWQKHRFPELAPLPAVSGLKPGQIPPASPTSAAPRPQAKMNIANARVGSPFRSQIEIALDNGARAAIEQVRFPEGSGLTFDAQSRVVSGTPLQSGDLLLNVIWSCAGCDVASTPLTLIVNPDPRSLWKVIDPPADAPFFKEDVDHQSIREEAVLLVAASRRGRSHEHTGAFRDDDFYIGRTGENGWNIMLVADGAGSAKNSREGSRIVTRTVGEYLTAQLSGSKGQDMIGRITRWEEEDRRSVGETFVTHFHKASVMAINNINNASMMADQPIKSFATTLLAAVSCRIGDELFAAAFWIGDGAIAAWGPPGKVRLLGIPDSGEYAGQTRFLDADALQDAEFGRRVSIGKWRGVSHLALMTDGVSDPRFETDNGLKEAGKWDALMAELAPCLQDKTQPERLLAEWLNFFSPGNHDDRTLVVSLYTDEPQSEGE